MGHRLVIKNNSKGKGSVRQKSKDVQTEFLNPIFRNIWLGLMVILLIFATYQYLFLGQLSEVAAEMGLADSADYHLLVAKQKNLFNSILLITSIISTVGIIAGAWIMAKKVKVPIQKMCAHFDKFSTLGETKKIQAEDFDNFYELADSFNKLVNRRTSGNRRAAYQESQGRIVKFK